MATVKVLVVGGGGGSGAGVGAGGGAGGYLYDAVHVVTPQAYAITIGAAGTAGTGSGTGSNGGKGGDSIFDTLTATGGGGGGGFYDGATDGPSPAAGGSGGAGAAAYSPGGSTAQMNGAAGNTPTTTPSQGNAGGKGAPLTNDTTLLASGGGGGSTSVGVDADSSGNGGNGGAGTANSISGASVTYAGGGGGTGNQGTGTNGTPATAGAANKGFGGGGVAHAGGSGVVIISYVTTVFAALSWTVTGGTITTDGLNTVHTFNSSGTWNIAAPFVGPFDNPYTTQHIRKNIRRTNSPSTGPNLLLELFTGTKPPFAAFRKGAPNPVRRTGPFVFRRPFKNPLFIEPFSPPAPTIIYATPPNDRTTGGGTIMLVGTNFLTGATVTVNGVAGTGVTIIDSTHMTFVAPANAAGSYTIVVTNTNTTTGSLSGFTYYAVNANPTALVVDIGGATPLILDGSVSSQQSASQGSTKFEIVPSGTRPVPFTPGRFGIGSLADRDLIMRGEVQVSKTIHKAETNIGWDGTLADSNGQFNRNLVWESYTTVDAGLVALDLLSKYAPDFTGAHIVTGLGTVSLVFQGVTMDVAFQAIATAIGGYYYRDESDDAHLFRTETPPLIPDPINSSNTSLILGTFSWEANTKQMRNKVTGVGAGTTVSGAVNIGDSIIPVADTSLFNAAGGTVLVGSQILTYTGKTQASPTTALTATLAVGAGIDAGAHKWAYTFVTAAGETLLSFLSPEIIAQVHTPAAPSAAPVSTTGPSSNFYASGPGTVVGGSYVFRAQCIGQGYSVVSADSAAIIAIACTNDPTIIAPIWVTVLVPDDPFINQVQLFASVNGGAFAPAGFYGVGPGGPNPCYYVGSTAGAAYTGAISATLERATITNVALGPSGTTQRKIYRNTVAAPLVFQLQQTIANNTSTSGVTDSSSDASLGAAAPSTDTSGLVIGAVTPSSGSTAAGATSLVLVSGTLFSSTGGWVSVAGYTVRYTGKSTNTLTGIPASGVGSIQAAIPSATTVISLPILSGIPTSGVGSILNLVPANANVSLYSSRNDLTSQALVAAIEGTNIRGVASTGIYEAKLNSSTTYPTQAALDAACDADLAIYAASTGVITATGVSYDSKIHYGRVIHIDKDGLLGDFLIQSVNITDIGFAKSTPPKYAWTASSIRFSFEDLFRKIVANLGA